MREADDRRADLVGVLDRPRDRLAALRPQRTALERAVLRPRADDPAVDPAGARQHAVAHQRARRPEGPGVEEQFQPRTRDQMLRSDIENGTHDLATARHAFWPPNPKEFDSASS